MILETRDGSDGQIGPDATLRDLANLDPGRIHPLTGPVFVKGAEPRDMLEIEFLNIVPQPFASPQSCLGSAFYVTL